MRLVVVNFLLICAGATAIHFDNKLTVIKNDCYERLAIGEKLSPEQTYKVFEHNTVSKCEMECTKEHKSCRAYSFGIGRKGNGTCLLGKNIIKETADLKPIGTIKDTEYDLYTKTLDCQIVLEPPQHSEEHLVTPQSVTIKVSKPTHTSQQHDYAVQEHHEDHHIPAQSNNYHNSVSQPSGYQYGKPHPAQLSPTNGASGGDGLHHIQTLVSIASGPESVLHPVHDILVSQDNYGQGHSPNPAGYQQNNANLPPFRPPALQHPYNDHKPPGNTNLQFGYGYGSLSYPPNPQGAYVNQNRPDPEIPSRPSYASEFSSGYGNEGHINVNRRKYQSHHSSYNSFESENHRYSLEHAQDYNPNYNFYDHYEKPFQNIPSKYGSVIPHPNDYDRPDFDYLFLRPGNDPHYRPHFDESGYGGPMKPFYDNRVPNMPGRPFEDFKPTNVGLGFSNYDTPNRGPGLNFVYGSEPTRPNKDSGYKYNVPTRPLKPSDSSGYGAPKPPPVFQDKPNNLSSSSRPPSTELSNHYGGVDYKNKYYGKPGEIYDKNYEGDRNVGQGSGGDKKVTGFITEIRQACFRRSFAGKRVVRSLVQKLLDCDTAEQCQQECADERQFTCEGFNYRLDPTGRGKGECELLDLPLSKLDISREIVTDPDYDIYTRDRNAVQVGCRQFPSASLHPGNYDGGGHGHGFYDGGNRRGDGFRPHGRPPLEIAPPIHRATNNWADDYRGEDLRPRPPLPPPPSVDRRPPPLLPIDRRPPAPPLIDRRPPAPPLIDRRPPVLPPIDGRPPHDESRRPEYDNRRGDYSFHHHSQHESHHHSSYHYNEHNVDSFDYHGDRHGPSGIHYLPASPYDNIPPKKYPVILPLDDKYHHSPPVPLEPPYPEDRYHPRNGYSGQKFWRYGGEYGDRFRHQEHRNYYVPTKPPPKPYIPEDWGAYGGSYGTGGLSLEYQGYSDKKGYNYWGLNKFDRDRPPSLYGSSLPPRPPKPEDSYLPPPRPASNGLGYLPYGTNGFELDNHILPAEPRKPGFMVLKDECSLRSATGFRLHKGIVKKLSTVPNIYECELLCVKEKEFFCASYAFRYTIHVGTLAADNCYLSTRNYKELDYYTDVEPDKDFDIYTMNNRDGCREPALVAEREESECFWRVRSGQRLDHSIVRDSLTVKTTVDCQLECLRSRRFTCRAYSFRYGSPIIGGIIDNCQLTDWPYFDLDPKSHFIPEPGFEIYERGSYGHGCEPYHFGIGKNPVIKDEGVKVDQLCYIGFGSAAKLLPQATIKSLYVLTELDCKVECSKAREGSVFRCMTFSFVTDGPKIGHNCYLSDIMQRDLLPNVDYVHDPTSWLFTWDNHNPECINLAYKPLHDGFPDTGLENVAKGLDYVNALDVWRVYSVRGWPCKRGTLCKENREAGFWYCELEGGEHDAWDYCCSPDHHCGLSNGYPYSWCYVGPSRTQWRKCNDQYYPYMHNALDRFDTDKRPWHTSGYIPPPQNHGYRPDRPSAPLRPEAPRPSLDQYEQQFDNDFLSPPKPGGFGQPRRWPVAYLHKEMPPNNTQPDAKSSRVEKSENSKLSAIKSLIDVIKNTEVENVQYHISNDSKKSDDILYVKIPIPTFDDGEENSTQPNIRGDKKVNFETVDSNQEETLRVQKSLPDRQQKAINFNKYSINNNTSQYSGKLTREYLRTENERKFPVYRRGFVTRTNLSSSGNYRAL